LNLKEDAFIRNFFYENLKETCISKIEIKRKINFIVINVSVVKPSLVIGNNGAKLYEFKNKLVNLLSVHFGERDITINILEIINPDSNSRVLTDYIRQQLEKRVPFRRVMKSAVTKAQKSGVKGIKVQVSGRLNGAEIARTEWIREGQVPLHTLKANIDYFNFKARVNL
jgi:small subunit ribosomal protein S3